MMRLAFIPRYTRHAASTRLRCYAIAEAISRLGLAEVQITSPTGIEVLDIERDVCVAQKSVDSLVFKRARIADWMVYDADDIIEAPTRRLIVYYVDCVTTDTELRAASIREWFSGPVHVIPDPIDYEDGPPKPPNPDAHPGVVWFGNYPNFESVRATMLHYQRCGERIGAISDLSPERANMPGLELIPWSYDSFPEELRKWRGCVLSHDGADQCKSANKLVAAIYLGVMPAYASGPSYLALLGELKGMSVAGAQAYIWEHYRAEAIARKAMEVYEGL